MATKKKSSKRKHEPTTVAPFVELIASGADDRIEVEVGDARVRLAPGFDPADLACILQVLANR